MACAWTHNQSWKRKLGACPKLPKGNTGFCVETCSGDYSCPGGMKCCRNDCGRVCKPSVFRNSNSDSHMKHG
uniref:WAP domain-containing protein n=2 Tax=Cavia porcellus TaxID=10141 RepID=A0A286XM70_CAVPO